MTDERARLRLSETQVEELLTYCVERYGPNSQEALCCRDWQDMRARLAACEGVIAGLREDVFVADQVAYAAERCIQSLEEFRGRQGLAFAIESWRYHKASGGEGGA